jgi:hypothetical protein
MGKLFTSLLLMLNVFNLNAQKYDYVWKLVYGWNSGINAMQPRITIDFNQQPPFVRVDSARVPPTMSCEMVSMSDSLGSYMFYTNGNSIININNQIMQNGDSLNYGAYSQNYPTIELGYRVIDGAICLPNPGNNNFYDLFHLKVDSFSSNYTINQLLRTKIDMNEDTGTVIFKNQIILEDSLTSGQLQAVKHANGIDWWILVSEQNTNGYYSFLLKEDTLEGPFYQQIGRNIYSWLGYGQACFSPDGTKYARFEDDLDIYDFDRCTGELCNHRFVEIDGWLDMTNRIPQGGCAFSTSGRFVYVTQLYELFQIDLWDVNPDSSLHRIDFIDINDSYPGYNLCRLAPDNKIYIGGHYDTAWSVINAPDNYGTACNTSYKSFYLGGVLDCFSLPNFPHYRMPAQDSCPPCGTFSGVEEVDEEGITSIKIYPNPAKDVLNLEWDSPIETPQTIQVFDLNGRLIQQKETSIGNSLLQLNTTNIPVGLYILRISDNAGNILANKKIVIVR